MLGVVRHDNRVRVPSAILNLGLAVFRWIFGPSREAFSVDVPHKKCSFCGNPGGGPPTITLLIYTLLGMVSLFILHYRAHCFWLVVVCVEYQYPPSIE